MGSPEDVHADADYVDGSVSSIFLSIRICPKYVKGYTRDTNEHVTIIWTIRNEEEQFP
jgi:hypothetical protein